MLPSAFPQGVGPSKFLQLALQVSYFAAQYPARTYPCRRFTPVLADDGARLGASVGRYSFTV